VENSEGNPEPPPQVLPHAVPVDAHIRDVPAAGPAVYVPRFAPLKTYFTGRLVAFVVDVFGVAFLCATFLFHIVFSQPASNGAVPLIGLGVNVAALRGAFGGSFFAIVAVSFVAACTFIWICESIFGTTLGKLLFGLAVRRAGGGHAGPLSVLLRNPKTGSRRANTRRRTSRRPMRHRPAA
jgi:hypothetical protein